MLSAPAKSAKRLTSLFLGSPKDDGESPSRPRRQSAEEPLPPVPPKPLRNAASAQHLKSEPTPQQPTGWRYVSAPPHPEQTNDDYLAPPPSLTALNPGLSDARDPHRRSQSAGGRISDRNRTPSQGRPESGSSGHTLSRPGTPNHESRLAKGLSWVPGKARPRSLEASPARPKLRAWIAGAKQAIPYDVRQLATGERIDELWDDDADTYVYLFPKETGRPPSFKVDSAIISASSSLMYLARGSDPDAARNWPARSSSRQLHPSGPQVVPQISLDDEFNVTDGRTSREVLVDEVREELHLYLPVPLESDVSNDDLRLHEDDVDTIIMYRNFLSFLVGQSLVASPKFPSIFSIFTGIAGLLSRFEFSNFDGSTFGETVNSSFGCYCDELGIMDVRKSREKTLDAIVLGEALRYLPLYNEGYVHCVGQLDDVKSLNSPKYLMISKITQKRMERGYIDLANRLKSVRTRLEDFDFPSLFAGFANSSMGNDSKIIRFKNWKNAYLAFRKHVMSYYRTRFGSWPPKATSKKNDFEESGLNRLVLKELYQDCADLYDMLVDRTSLTTRSADMTLTALENESGDIHESISRAMRQVMSEYDRSTPPVQPPIPFDTPRLPNIQSIRRKQLDAKKLRTENGKRLSSGEINEILANEYNHKDMKPTPFLEEFIRFERRTGSGKSCDELVDHRCGQWLFMYAVLQALPMLVVDAADVRHGDGVEHFLCIPPRGGSPWCRDDSKSARSWFGVAGGTGVVNLPSDVVTHGVEGVYRRSHCWQVAAKWADEQDMLSSAMEHLSTNPNPERSPSMMPPPPPALSSTGSSSDRQTAGAHTPATLSIPRPHSPMGRAGNRSSIHMGLEALPLPANVVPSDTPNQSSRPVSHNPGMSFDQILGDMPKKGKR